MDVLVGIVATILIIGTLVILHELGHFATARLFGIQVDEFGVGFPPRLRAWRRGETEYTLNAIPLGGFVRMVGENGDSLSPRSFGAKPAWQRAVVLCAGAAMNLLTALILFFVLFAIVGQPAMLPTVQKTAPGSPAAALLRPGDRIIAVDGQRVEYLTDLQRAISGRLGRQVALDVRRSGAIVHVRLTPRVRPPAGQGAMGIVGGALGFQRMPVGTAVGTTLHTPVDMVQGMWGLLTSPAIRNQSGGVSGPVGIARATGQAANAVPRLGIGPLLELAGLLSLNFAIINLLPLPALDGGRLLIVLFGALRRRRVDPQLEGTIHAVGMAALLLLMVVITWHDIAGWLASS